MMIGTIPTLALLTPTELDVIRAYCADDRPMMSAEVIPGHGHDAGYDSSDLIVEIRYRQDGDSAVYGAGRVWQADFGVLRRAVTFWSGLTGRDVTVRPGCSLWAD